MSERVSGSNSHTLYGALAQPARAGVAGRETLITFTKETVDNDQEAEHTFILLDGR